MGADNELVLLSDPANTGALESSGDATLTVVGVLDTPAGALAATGNARITVIAGTVVADAVTATGNATITVEGQPAAPSSPAPSSPPPAVS